MEDYISTEATCVGEEYLEHHGIKGMHWGVRRTREQLDRLAGRSQSSKELRSYQKKAFDDALEYSRTIELESKKGVPNRSIVEKYTEVIKDLRSTMGDSGIEKCKELLKKSKDISLQEESTFLDKLDEIEDKLSKILDEEEYWKAYSNPDTYSEADKHLEVAESEQRKQRVYSDLISGEPKSYHQYSKEHTKNELSRRYHEVKNDPFGVNALSRDLHNIVVSREMRNMTKHSDECEDYISTEATCAGEDYLEHHGIKGMHWGIRRTREQLDRLAGRKHVPDSERKKVFGPQAKKKSSSSSETEKEYPDDDIRSLMKKPVRELNDEQLKKVLDRQASELKWVENQRNMVARQNEVSRARNDFLRDDVRNLMNKPVSQLNNAELMAVNSRREEELRYAKDHPKKVSAGRKFIDKSRQILLDDILIPSAKEYGKAATDKWVKDYIKDTYGIDMNGKTSKDLSKYLGLDYKDIPSSYREAVAKEAKNKDNYEQSLKSINDRAAKQRETDAAQKKARKLERDAKRRRQRKIRSIRTSWVSPDAALFTGMSMVNKYQNVRLDGKRTK